MMDCVRQDMRDVAVSDDMTSDRGEWRQKTCCADPKLIGKKAGRRRIPIIHQNNKNCRHGGRLIVAIIAVLKC
jgi:hypothetical protein